MKKLLALRYLLSPIILFLFLISLFFMIRGMMLTVDVGVSLFNGTPVNNHLVRSVDYQTPGLILLEAVDFFLLSFVLFVFSFGLLKILFFPHSVALDEKLPKWLNIESIFELKALLWQSILTTAVMLFLNHAVIMVSSGEMNHSLLFLPGSILLVAIALFFLKKSEVEKNHD